MQETAYWRAVPILLLAHLLQTTWFARFEVFDTKLDLPLLVAVSIALSGGVQRGAWAGLFAGLLTGLQPGAYVGSFLVSRMIGAGVVGFSPRGLTADNPLAPPLCAVAATVIADFIFMIMSPTIYPFNWWIKHAIVASALHAIVIWPIFFLIHRISVPTVRPTYL